LLQGCTPSYAHQLSSDLLALPNEWWIVLFLFFHILPINTYYNGWLAHKWWIGILCYFIFSYIYIHIFLHDIPILYHDFPIQHKSTTTRRSPLIGRQWSQALLLFEEPPAERTSTRFDTGKAIKYLEMPRFSRPIGCTWRFSSPKAAFPSFGLPTCQMPGFLLFFKILILTIDLLNWDNIRISRSSLT
jgi:hypothetical protein